jgi:Tol biopolymer transport system component
MIAFQRVDLTGSVGNGPTPPRVWLYDIETTSARPLFRDNQQLGYMPRWSPDGSQLALYNPAVNTMVVHNFTSNEDILIPAKDGEIGAFSPDGKWIYYPKFITLNDGLGAVHIVLAELLTGKLQTLVSDSEAINENAVAWRGDSQSLIIARQPPIRQTSTGSDLYEVNISTKEATLLVPYEDNIQSDLIVSPKGDMMVFQRRPLSKTTARSRLWLYHFDSKKLQPLPEDATSARWLS